MQPPGNASTGAAPRAAGVRGALIRVGIAAVVALTGASARIPAASAQPSTTEPQAAEASNGGVASATTGGEVNIGQIITGENTGNSIATGDVAGSAEINGGAIDYPTDVTVSLELGPPVATADGGDEGSANASDDDSQSDDDTNAGKDGEDITIINRNDNRSTAKVVEKGRG